MKALLIAGMAVLATVAVMVTGNAGESRKANDMIGHMVYFTLKDNTPEAREKLVAACKKYLNDHPGTVYFSAGVLCDDLKREVNDRDWDVALHLVFKDRASHDKYQDAARHNQFIEENKGNWKKVRVFDSEVAP